MQKSILVKEQKSGEKTSTKEQENMLFDLACGTWRADSAEVIWLGSQDGGQSEREC